MTPVQFYHWLRRPARTWTAVELRAVIRGFEVLMIVCLLNISAFMLHDAVRAWTPIPLSAIEYRWVLTHPMIGGLTGMLLGCVVLSIQLDKIEARDALARVTAAATLGRSRLNEGETVA